MKEREKKAEAEWNEVEGKEKEVGEEMEKRRVGGEGNKGESGT